MVTSAEELYYRRYLNDLSGNQGYQGGGAGVVTSYSDPLTVADPLNSNGGKLDGTKWWFGCAVPVTNNTPLDTPTYSIAASSKDSQNALLWGLAGATNPQEQAKAYLLPIATYLSCYGLTQFSQCTLVQVVNANGIITAGVTVMCVPANGQYFAYIFCVYSVDHSWFLIRYGLTPATLQTGAANSTSDGDILRLSADISVPGQVTLTVKKNGNVLTTYVDNSGSRLLIGSPGLGALPTQGSSTPKSDWRTFSCGIGL